MPNPIRQTAHSSTKLKTLSVLDRIRPIEFTEETGLKILIYGKSGSGKTTLAGTFPSPILWIVCSGGNRSGELRSLDTPELRKKISQVVIGYTSEIKEIIDHVKETKKYATVVLDHGSGLQDLTLKEVLGLDELPAQKSWGMATQSHYGQSGVQTKEILRALLGLPGNVVIIAQERTFGGKEDGGDPEVMKPTIGPSLTPSVTGWLCPSCDYVVQTYIRPRMETFTTTLAGKQVSQERRGTGVEYCLRTAPHDFYLTKFRIPKGRNLPECIVDPDHDKILALINGEEVE